jgi:hypothetical protein
MNRDDHKRKTTVKKKETKNNGDESKEGRYLLGVIGKIVCR